MNYSNCEKCAFECIFLNQPSAVDSIRSIEAFGRLFGRNFTEAEISAAVDNLLSNGQIVLMTTDKKSTVLTQLKDVHGPLIAFEPYPYYSVTETGGKAWLKLLSGKTTSNDGFEKTVSEHVQWFTPSLALAQSLAEQPGHSADILKISDVYLAPNNDSAIGYLIDFIGHPDDLSSLVRLHYDLCFSLEEVIAKFLHDNPSDFGYKLTPHELAILFKISGHCGPAALQGITKSQSNSLRVKKLAATIQKNDTLSMRHLIQNSHGNLVGSALSTGDHVATIKGMEVLSKLLCSFPELNQHLLAYHNVGRHVHHYFSSTDTVSTLQDRLLQRGVLLGKIEFIERWCDYWWNIHADGVRFSYWENSVKSHSNR